MLKTQKEAYKKSAFKTVFQFGQSHKIKKADKEHLNRAAEALYRTGVKVSNPSGNRVPAIIRNTASHNGTSPFLVNPLAGRILLDKFEAEKQSALAKKAKEAAK